MLKASYPLIDIRRLRKELNHEPLALIATPVPPDLLRGGTVSRVFLRDVQESRLASPCRVVAEQEIVELENSLDYEFILPIVEAGLLVSHRLQNVRSITYPSARN